MIKVIRMLRYKLLLGIGLTAFASADLAFGQGWGGPGGGFGGPGGGFGGPGGGGFSFSDYLSRKDENRNGVLDPEEWQNSRSRSMIENAAKEAGIDLTRPIPIDRLQAAMTAQREKMGGGGGFGGGFGGPGGSFGGPGGSGWGRPPESSNNNPSDSHRSDTQRSESRREDRNKSSLPPGVPGFGEKVDLKPVLGFGSALNPTQLASAAPQSKEEERSRDKERKEDRKENRDQPREERRDSGSRDSGGRDSGGGERSARDKEDYERREREKNRDTAKSMVAQNDTNKDGHLAKRDDEWKNLRGTPENADYNKDGIITVDELTERLMERSREQYASSSSRGGYASKPATGTNGKPVRFLTATERLPEGLPTWFTRGDLNGDGQVSMSEYATKWDDAKLAEFMKYDINADGMITSTECIAVEKSRGGSSSGRTASTFGAPSGGPPSDKAAPPADKPGEKSGEKPAAAADKPAGASVPVASASE